MRFFSSILFCILIIGFGCSEDDCNEYDSPFTIEEGGTYCHPELGEFTITEISNSYCRCDVDCIWQGEALVTGSFTTIRPVDIMIHEELTDQNNYGFSIHSVSLSEDCTSAIEEIRIMISQ